MKRERSLGVNLLISILICVLVISLGYVFLALYYRNTFGYNTWINGIYCTGKSVEEVNSELLAVMEMPVVTVTDRDGMSYSIILEDADYAGDYSLPLRQFQENQESFFWLQDAFRREDCALLPITSYDESKLQALWNELPFVQAEKGKKNGLEILYDEQDGYAVEDGMHGRFRLDKAYDEFVAAIENGETSVIFDEDDYYDVTMTEEEKAMWKLWEQIDSYQSAELTFDMGEEQVLLETSDLSTFLEKEEESNMPLLNEDGELTLNEKEIKNYIAALAETYDTVGKEREFQSTRGDVITISGGTYGMKLDQKGEITFLTDFLTEAAAGKVPKENHEAIYSQTTKAFGENDIGDTYVEVDMSRQMLYYYEDGVLLLKTEVVTGNLAHKTGTPQGVDFVYAKQKNRVLRGDGYESFVKYWMPVYRGVGLHDASWRSKFGGEIYKTAGSHGCVNLPTSIAGEIYDLVDIGTPVVMFY